MARLSVREDRGEITNGLVNQYFIAKELLGQFRASLSQESGVSDARLKEFEQLMDAKNELANKLRDMGIEPNDLVSPATTH